MSLRVWDVSKDGDIQFVSVTPELLQGALDVLRNGFYPHESISVAVDLINHPDAMSELDGLCITTAKDGVTIVAVEKATGKVAGVAFNKLQVKTNPGEASFFEDYAAKCKHPISKNLIQFMIDVNATVDLFEHCQVDCLLEVMFLAMSPEFRNRGIGRKLCEVSVAVAKSLKSGENVKQTLEPGQSLPLEPVPQIVAAMFTSPTSQKIGKSLNWEIAARRRFEEFFYDGKAYSSVLGKEIPDTALEFTRI